MTTPPDPLVGDTAALAASADRLADRLAAGTDSLESVLDQLRELRGEQKKSWRAIFGSYGLWLFDIAAIIVSVVVVASITTDLRQQGQRLEDSIHETCTLYGFIIPSYRESSRQASPMGPEGYDSFYRQMQTSADNLGCGIPHRI